MTFIEHLDDAAIQDLEDGLTPEDQARAARTHLEHCAFCRTRATEMAALFAELEAPESIPEAPAELFSSVMARVDREILPALAKAPERRLAIAVRSLAAGLLVAAAGFVLFWAGGGLAAAGSVAAETASTLAGIAGKFDLALTVARAAAPVAAAAAAASLAVLIPLILKVLPTTRSKTARAHAR